MNNEYSRFTWQNIKSAACQLSKTDPYKSYTLYKMAIAECRQSLGPNSDALGDLFIEISRVCSALDLTSEAEDYATKAIQIRVYNLPASPFKKMPSMEDSSNLC